MFSCSLCRIATLSAYIRTIHIYEGRQTCRGIAEVDGEGSVVAAPGGADQGSEKKKIKSQTEYFKRKTCIFCVQQILNFRVKQK